MPSDSTAFAIRDAVKSALEAQAFITARSGHVDSMPLPTFDVVEAGESLRLVVAAYESTGIKSVDRSGVAKLYRIGIGVYRKLPFVGGKIVDAAMDDMIRLIEQIEQWGWSGVNQYGCVLSKTANDALYDAQKARASPAVFFNVINLDFVADYDK